MEALLNAIERQDIARKVRKMGYIPASIYGPGINKNLDIQIEQRTLNKFIKKNPVGSKTVIQLKDSKVPCIIKKLEYNLMNDTLIHVDFYVSPKN